jgi:hypothetical protein
MLTNHVQSWTLAHTHTHTHIFFNNPAVVGSTGGTLLLESAGSDIALDLMSSLVAKQRSSQKIARSEIRRLRWLGDDTTSDVWLCAETGVPACHLWRCFR